MGERELKIKEISNLLKLAEEYLEGAEDALDSSHLRIAIDAAYNVAELCAKGSLLFEMEELPSSHGGVIGEFGRLYVKTENVPKELGRRLNRGLEVRNKARYDFNADISKERAVELIELAKRMVSLLDGKLADFPR